MTQTLLHCVRRPGESQYAPDLSGSKVLAAKPPSAFGSKFGYVHAGAVDGFHERFAFSLRSLSMVQATATRR
jgi:hypothetical protein